MDAMAILNNNAGSVEAEGFHISDEDKLLVLHCLRGEITFEEAVELVKSRA